MHRRTHWLSLLALLAALGLFTPALAAADAAVTHGGTIRTEPRIAAATVLGQVCIGDHVTVLDGRKVGAAVWYHVKVASLTTGACRVAKHAAVGAEGWVAASLLSKPSEDVTIVTPTPKPKPPSTGGGSGGSGGGGSGGQRVGAICRDGSHSNATGRGACSHHGGVDHWLYGP